MVLSVNELLTLVRHQILSKYFNVASAAVLIYETIYNFSDEIELIWRQRLSVGKVLYLASRYMAFVDISLMLLYLFHPHLEPETCHHLYIAELYFTLAGACIAEFVLLIRVYAIWKQSARILAFLVVLSIVLLLLSILNLNIHNHLKTLKFIPSPAPTIMPCFIPTIPIRAFLDFGCLLIVDLAVLVLTVWGGFRFWKEDASSPLITTFYRDGVLYFLCLFAMSSANVVVFIIGDPEQRGILVELQRVLHSVLSTRIILNLRKIVTVTEDECKKDLTTAVFGELVSDPFYESSTSDISQSSESEEGVELQDVGHAAGSVVNDTGTSVVLECATDSLGFS